MMNKLLIISVFGDILEDNSRIASINTYCNISKKIVLSDFDHSRKLYRNNKSKDVDYIHTIAYKKNISYMRMFSHVVFAYRLKRYLNSLTFMPTAIYCSMPTSTAAYICGKWCKKNNVKFIIDVIDLWPDSLFPLISYKRIISIITYPWKWLTIQTYKMADVIIGESKEYANVAAKYNVQALVYPLYLGVDIIKVKELINNSSIKLNKNQDEIWIAYGGSLGKSYDFDTLIKGISTLNGKYKYKLWLIGDGDSRFAIEKQLEYYKVNAEITGFVSYMDYLKYLTYCDIAVNIFKSDTKVVHSYKFNDYVATNCFILNSLVGETADMINKYHIGLNFDFKENSFDKIIIECVSNWSKYKVYRNNNNKLISELLDKKMTYSKLNDIFIEK